MFYTKFDGYYYSRPVSYKSYYARIDKPEILVENDVDTQDILKFLQANNIVVNNLGGLSRGIRFDDIQIGKRKYNHNSTSSEYYIHQWKPTNDCKNHPTGSHFVTKSYQSLVKELERVIVDKRKLYK